jgi:hypothetical protein
MHVRTLSVRAHRLIRRLSLVLAAVFYLSGIILPVSGWMMAQAAEAVRIAVFDFELQDASHEGAIDGERPDQVARLHLVSDELRSLMEKSDRFELIDIAPARPAVAEKGPLIYCNGCDREIAAGLDADYALTGLVYKVSNLILEIHIHIRDVESGRIISKLSSSIRGNTDESWLHGVRWMFRNRLMTAEFLK